MTSEISFDFDIHICGACRAQLPTIDLFIEHKKLCDQSINRKSKENSENASEMSETIGLDQQQTENEHFSAINNSPIKDQTKIQRLFSVSPLFPINLSESAIEQQVLNSPINAKEVLNETGIGTKKDIEIKQVSSQQITTQATQDQRVILTKNSQVKYTVLITGGPKRYKCEYGACSYTSLYMKDLERHFRTHTGEKPFFCYECGKRFTRSDKLKNHERTHTGERPHKCSHCSYATIDRSTLLKHMRIHSDERPFKCQICPHASRNSSQLVVHLRTHTGDTPFHCPVCSMKFKVNCDLKRHMLMHSGIKPFSCSLCDYKCSVKGNLKSHMKLKHCDENEFGCSECSYATSSRSELREHSRQHVEKPARCSQCPYSASNQSTLRIHQRVHSKEKPFQCEHCPYTSRQSCNIRTHVKKKHPDKLSRLNIRKVSQVNLETIISETTTTTSLKGVSAKSPSCSKTFKCNLCEAAFVRKDSLQSHLRQHQVNHQADEPSTTSLAMLQLQTVARENIISVISPSLPDESHLDNTLSFQEMALDSRQHQNTKRLRSNLVFNRNNNKTEAEECVTILQNISESSLEENSRESVISSLNIPDESNPPPPDGGAIHLLISNTEEECLINREVQQYIYEIPKNTGLPNQHKIKATSSSPHPLEEEVDQLLINSLNQFDKQLSITVQPSVQYILHR